MHRLVIQGTLPNLNDYISAERKNRFMAASLKNKWQTVIAIQAKMQLKGYHPKRVRMHYTWYEQTRRRDLDNVSSFGRKLIQDALVEVGILENDGWQNITGFSDNFVIDKNNPRVEVEFEEVEN